MPAGGANDAGKAIQILVSDALEALVPLVDEWALLVTKRAGGIRTRGFAEGYAAGIEGMRSEVKDQLIERVLRLREQVRSVEHNEGD
ncbi:MAG: hypothetical protein ACRDFX_11145 [Chloroflexota bacterium]